MMKRKFLPLLFALMIGFALPLAAMAQDEATSTQDAVFVTNTPDIAAPDVTVLPVETATPEATEIVVVPVEPTIAASEVAPTPTPTPDQPPVIVVPPVQQDNRLSALFAVLIAFALYCLSLAGAVQIAVNQLKPLFIDPFKDKLSDAQNLGVIYGVRTLVTAVAYFYVWGGVVATRLIVPGLPAVIPDVGIALVTILLVVLGEEILHPIIDRLYILRDLAAALGNLPSPLENSLKSENERLNRENLVLKSNFTFNTPSNSTADIQQMIDNALNHAVSRG